MSDSISQAQSISQSLRTSDPAIIHFSEPSIRTLQRSANIMKFIFVILAFFSVGALLLGAGLYRMQKTKYLNEKEQAEAQAAELKHIIPQSLTLDEELEVNTIKPETKTVFFSLFTTPPGADVYVDSRFVGTTPIERVQMDKSSDTHKLIISLEGYNIDRKNITFSDDYSELITLSEKVIAQAKTADGTQETAISDTVFENKGVIINQPAKKSKKDHKDSAAAPVDTGIVLPD